ncbi:glycerol-3-phosphate responsive antiterminator [Sporosarcina sp. CAU 1771]
MCNKIIPAIRNMKDFDDVLKTDHELIILLETRLSQLESTIKYAKQHKKKVLIHADLVRGLKVDEYGLEYLIHNVKVDGIISTKANVISFAKKHNVIGIQRLFALDSHALNHNLNVCKKIKPDYIEILPGVIPTIIKEVYDETGIPIIAGGLIRTQRDVENAFKSSAYAVTTSNKELW